MAGVDTVRGIAYQQAQAVLVALELLDDPDLESMRVEGVDDIVDIEVFAVGGSLHRAMQAKIRDQEYTWGKAELIGVLRRWAALPEAASASFEFVTDGRLGPTGRDVADALDQARSGDRKVLAALLEEQADGDVCVALTSARVRLDPSPAEALLSRAERQVRAMLPSPRTAADAREQAEQAIDRLFRAMFVRASDAEPQARLLTRAEIAQILGVSADQAASQRWPGQLRDLYLDAARSQDVGSLVPAVVTAGAPSAPLMNRTDGDSDRTPQAVSALLHKDGPSVLAGRTGSGKSTAGHLLRCDAAQDGRVVLYAHAEGYLPDRLAALAADAISEVVEQDLPSSTGRQALADEDVTLVIDGVSEVPDDVRAGLQAELLAPLAAGHGARVVLLGRDVALLRETLPTSQVPTAYQLLELDGQRRLDLACRTLHGFSAEDADHADRLPAVRVQLAQAEKALGDAAGNPLLLAMALTLIGAGIAFTDRAGLYERFVERLAERCGAAGIAQASAALGVAYAALLDQGRRYANPIEWARVLTDAVATLSSNGVSITAASVDSTARRCGLITPLGWVQTLVPIHDSFADYLAGAAHAQRLVELPERLRPDDEQRIAFAAEIGGVDAVMAERVAKHLPFLLVRLAAHERRGLAEDAPAEIERLLRLLDTDHGYGVGLWKTTDGTVVALRREGCSSQWLDGDTARAMMKTTPAVIVEDPGPLKVAVRVWRQSLVLRLKAPQTLPMPQPASRDHACATLREHTVRAANATRDLIATLAPPGHDSTLAGRVGPLGLRAMVRPSEQRFGSTWWPVSYRPSDTVDVYEAPDNALDASVDGRNWGDSTVEGLTRRSPEAEASDRLRAAIEELTVSAWLAP